MEQNTTRLGHKEAAQMYLRVIGPGSCSCTRFCTFFIFYYFNSLTYVEEKLKFVRIFSEE